MIIVCVPFHVLRAVFFIFKYHFFIISSSRIVVVVIALIIFLLYTLKADWKIKPFSSCFHLDILKWTTVTLET